MKNPTTYQYKIFHLDGISTDRDLATSSLKSRLADVPELNVSTINYSDEYEIKKFISKFPKFKPNRNFKVGELGIWASNYQAWSEFLDSKYDCLLLFEDDIKIDDNFLQGMDDYLNRLPNNWDFFSPYVHWWQSQNIYNSYRDNIGDTDICSSYQSWSLACYFISKNGVKKALEDLNNGFNDPVDWYIYKNKELFNIYTLKPGSNKYCDLLYLNTTIQEENMNNYPNWFAMGAYWFFQKHLTSLQGKENLQFLQIGTYTGDASVWMMDNVLTHPNSILTDVDTWEGSEEQVHKEFDWKNVEETYDEKVSKYNNIIKEKSTSVEFLNSAPKDYYDFIYIDGDHTEAAVYQDAVLSWDKLKSGGILGFDDYTWWHESGLDSMRPGPAVDRFVKEHAGQLDVLDINIQYWVKKK
jgi:GR25 family glycosyltransferase involved in LPS biosynthesis/predicted O-methyltransferase YrrM